MKNDEAGSGTVLMLGLVGLAGLLMGLALSMGNAVALRHRAAAAADLAALAAVDSTSAGSPGSGCAVAAQVARRNGATLVDCSPGIDGTVVVTVVVESPGLRRTARGSARAGPGPAQIPPDGRPDRARRR